MSRSDDGWWILETTEIIGAGRNAMEMRMTKVVDEDGQPPKRFYRERTTDRAIQEMLGMIKGVVCDGVLNEDEIRAFRRWLQTNPDATIEWPGRDLATRIVKIFEDGRVDKHEQHELYELFCDTVGDGGPAAAGTNYPSRFPLDDPPPSVFFDGHAFCFTGIFAYGTRAQCHAVTAARGAKCVEDIIHPPAYLVIGTRASEAWVQSGWGRKVEAAIAGRDAGRDIHIISEAHWADALAAEM